MYFKFLVIRKQVNKNVIKKVLCSWFYSINTPFSIITNKYTVNTSLLLSSWSMLLEITFLKAVLIL